METESITISVKHLSSRVYEITINPKATVDQLKTKVSELSGIAKIGIKLIFRGKILKVGSTLLSELGVTNGHTIHMVKDKSKTVEKTPLGKDLNPNPGQTGVPNQPSSNPFAQNPTQTGYIPPGGYNQGFGNRFDYPAMQEAMQNPQMREMMQGLLSNPELLKSMIQSNPMLSSMVSSNPHFQSMLDNPEMLRNMSNMMSSGSMPGFPGVNVGQQGTTPGNTTNPNATPQNPTPGQNPNTQPGTTPPPPQMGTPNLPGFGNLNQMPDLNAMMNDPAFQARMNQFRNQFMNNQGGNTGNIPTPGTNPGMGLGGMNMGMGGLGGMNAPIPPQNVTDPEETYKEQLKQLEGMGFTNKELNIAVLKQTYGNVQMAIERLLNM
jgi:ubiquilin